MKVKREYIFIVLTFFLIPLGIYIGFSFFQKEKPNQVTTETFENQKQAPVLEPISFLFVGDIMLDRTIKKDGEAYGYDSLFSCLKKEFEGYDEVIGNLEGTVTNFESVSRDAAYESPQSFRFTFDPKALQSLADIGLSTVSLANNHIRDFGEEGIMQTLENTERMNVATFGNPQKGKVRYLLKEIKGTTFTFIPYNQFFGTPEQTLEDLTSVREISDMQIIFAHWGDEYTPARTDIKNLAHSFVQNGADLIIGAHPHVIQESEIYQGVPIYYSLGNFIFDQYWEPAVREGLAVSFKIQNNKIIDTQEKKFESRRHAGTCKKAP